METGPKKRSSSPGFGGQGIVMAGDILGKAATLHDLKHATMIQAYGPEARGGSCSTQVIISDEEILFPYVRRARGADLHEPGGLCEKHQPRCRPAALLIWDTDLVETRELDPGWTTYNIPATRFAEELGNKMMANIVMLGFLAAVERRRAALDSLRQAVLGFGARRQQGKQRRAFDRGREYGEAIQKSRAKQEQAPGEHLHEAESSSRRQR